MSEKRSIIDIGSNTLRLVIYNGPPRAPVVILNEKVNARLGRDLGKTGRLSDKAVTAALDALKRFATLLRMQGVEQVECVATAATRDAENGGEFLDAVRALGLSPRLLSGEDEAAASATGVVAAFPGAQGTVGDLGGGSLELVSINDQGCKGGITVPFGTLRLADLREGGPAAFAVAVKTGLDKAGWQGGKGSPLFIVGGSWRAVALQAMRELDWPLDDPHGFELAPEPAQRICRVLERGKIDAPDPRISSSRLATLPDAAALLGRLIALLEPSRIVFSSWGLREGLLYAQLPPELRAEDPMLAGVEAFARTSLVERRHADAVAQWVAPVCEDRPGDGHMRLAATMLALAAMRSEPNMRTEQAMGWALRKRWIGLDAHGRAMLAMTVFANSGLTDIPPEFSVLASQDDLDRAIVWGLAVRLCRRLTTCSAKAMASTSLRIEDGTLVLALHGTMQALYSNAIGKDLRALAERLGMEHTVKMLAEA